MKTTETDNQNGSTEQRSKQQALLDEWGVTEQELKEWEQDEVNGREAAYAERCDEELCRKLIGKFARESAKRTSGDTGEIRDRYETIVLEFLAVRYTQPDRKGYSLSTALRSKYETDEALQKFLPEFDNWIGEYVSDCIREHNFEFTPLYQQTVPAHIWTLCDHCVSKVLLTALALEYVADREGLMQFLSEVFKHWRILFAQYSPWRVRLLAQQITGTSNEVAAAMVSIGAAPGNSQSLGDRVRQYRSRDQRAALGAVTKPR